MIGNAQGAAAGSSFNLTGWNNLTSVQFQSTGSNINHLAFDNIVVNESPQTNAVPEPTSIALLGLGALGFAASRHKKSA